MLCRVSLFLSMALFLLLRLFVFPLFPYTTLFRSTIGAGPVGDEAHSAGIGVVRVQRDFGGESTIGMLATDRSLAGGSNGVVSADTRLKLSKTWVFSGQAMATRTRGTSGAPS